jgi:hypothetical protein
MGLEPTTYAVTGRRCNQLNYTPAYQKSMYGRKYRKPKTLSSLKKAEVALVFQQGIKALVGWKQKLNC